MTALGLRVIDHTVQETHEWLNEIMSEIGYKDRQIAYHALRSVLHAIRDIIAPEAAAKFASQLPILIRGIFYEGYTPTGKPIFHADKEKFLENINKEFSQIGGRDPVIMAQAVFTVINDRISVGEVEKIRQSLPKNIREIWIDNIPISKKI